LVAAIVICGTIAGLSYHNRHNGYYVTKPTVVVATGRSGSATLAATPGGGLTDGQSIKVRLAGWAAGGVNISECASSADTRGGGCSGTGEGVSNISTDSTGVGVGGFVVSIWAYPSLVSVVPAVLCNSQCVLVASQANGGVVAVAPIAFAP
jgi:hypothetical protein